MEQPYVPKLDVVRRTESTSTPGVPKRPDLLRGDGEAEDPVIIQIEQDITRALTRHATEAEAIVLLEAYIDRLHDQMHINDQWGAFHTSGEIFKIKQQAMEGEHAEFMAGFTKANLSDYTDFTRKCTKVIEYRLGQILEKDVLNQYRGILERAMERFFSRHNG